MSAHANAMPTVSNSSLRPHRPLLPRWLGVVFPIVILASIGFAVAYVMNRTLVPFVVALATAVGLGLISGFTARLALRNRDDVVRGLVALAALAVGLLMLGMMTLGEAGIGPLRHPLTGPDWRGLGQFALGALAALLALRAWRTTAPAVRRPLRQRLLSWRDAASAGARARWEGLASAFRHGIDWAGNWFARAGAWVENASHMPYPETPPPAPRVRVHGAGVPRSRPGRGALERFREWVNRRQGPAAGGNGRWLQPRRRSNIRFVGVEEHRCPYCLELVEPNDPRGVEICSTCHTRHHADCWAITGVCQVPHYHTEGH